MDKLMIPPNPNWFAQSITFCTPDNGLIYGAMTKIVYIPPKSEDQKPELKIIDLKNKLCCFSIDPDWSSDLKRLAIVNADFNVLVYEFDSGEPIKGHKGHENESRPMNNHQQPFTAVAFLKQNAVLSSVNSNLIYYCLLTNTYKIFLDFSTRNPISILKQSPTDSSLVAAGTKNGLILLIDVIKVEVIVKLRGHDTEITSLDFMNLSLKEEKTTLENLIASTDTSDCFDIYEENVEQEFGAYRGAVEEGSDDDEEIAAEMQEKMVSDSNFNFLEACNNLKGEILAENGSEGENMTGEGTFDDNKDQYGLKNEANPSLYSNSPSRTPVLTEESLNYLDECQRMKDFVIVSKEDVAPSSDDLPVLASGSREQIAWIWNLNERVALNKIKWHPKTRPSLPTPFTNVLWVDKTTLLVTDGNGDIVEYKISSDGKSKEEKDKKFDAKGVLNMCKSSDGSVLWTSSIHRHISCLEIAKNFEKLVSLDTIQIRIHFIMENPFDSNVIAIGGNDKRLCLWNTSDAITHVISLRPFMNKIHSGVLCLSWHPEKDNLLAFSTREGRIGVLDVNKSTNVPTILASFSSQEVYSIAWAKFKDSVVLIACNGHKLVYYTQKEQWKIRHVETIKHAVSVAVNEEILAVGTGNGDLLILDLSKDFEVIAKKKICKKYIGMMTWHEKSLAVASESGVTLIKNVIADENLIKLEAHKGRVFSVRFNKAGNLLVSCCINSYVKVWDLNSNLVLASFSIETSAYTAIFLPSNEDFVVCGGQDSTVMIFEWRKYTESDENEVGMKKRQLQRVKNTQWAPPPTEVTTMSKNRKQKKKVVKTDEVISELSTDIVKLNLQTKISTIFNSANRELTANPLEFIEKMLSGEERELSFNEKIFESREKVKEVIEAELIENKKTNSLGSVILPQISDGLRNDILERIANKTLHEAHVAVAPSVSFDIWRKCCVAFAHQCIEKEDSLTAIPYLLAVNEVDTCINQLCDRKFFREAWTIAKMRKDDADPIFEVIMGRWIAYYDYSGNYEAGAALLTCKKDFKKAAEILERRQNKSEKCARIIELLSNKTA